MAEVKPRFMQLATVLTHLDATYGFRHRDLHSGNVMFTSTMQVKIIDFGRSCMNFEWSPGRSSLFTMNKWGADTIPKAILKGQPKGCFSLDLFIYLINNIKSWGMGSIVTGMYSQKMMKILFNASNLGR
jgi:serine/threonine protein kinase